MSADRRLPLALRDLNACESRGPHKSDRGPSIESAGAKENALGLAKASGKREGLSSESEAPIAHVTSARFRATRACMLEAAVAADGAATLEHARYDGAASAPARVSAEDRLVLLGRAAAARDAVSVLTSDDDPV